MPNPKGPRMMMPRRPREVALPFDIIEGRLTHLGVPALLAEMRAEWDGHNNEDRGWVADRLAEVPDDELRAGFEAYRSQADAG